MISKINFQWSNHFISQKAKKKKRNNFLFVDNHQFNEKKIVEFFFFINMFNKWIFDFRIEKKIYFCVDDEIIDIICFKHIAITKHIQYFVRKYSNEMLIFINKFFVQINENSKFMIVHNIMIQKFEKFKILNKNFFKKMIDYKLN